MSCNFCLKKKQTNRTKQFHCTVKGLRVTGTMPEIIHLLKNRLCFYRPPLPFSTTLKINVNHYLFFKKRKILSLLPYSVMEKNKRRAFSCCSVHLCPLIFLCNLFVICRFDSDCLWQSNLCDFFLIFEKRLYEKWLFKMGGGE